MSDAELISRLQDAVNGEQAFYLRDLLQAIDRIEQYNVAVKELFSLLDTTEETDEGRVHRPVQIVCVRTDMLIKLENVLATLKSTMEEDMK
jgi:ABC-type bacteriocin/lantibiotic exporter with double-glycine peptidase domain